MSVPLDGVTLRNPTFEIILLSNIVGEDRLEYCVHFESRTPDYDPSELQDLINFINGLELNELDRDLHLEDQSGCW